MKSTRLAATLGTVALAAAVLTGCSATDDDRCQPQTVFHGADGMYHLYSPVGPVFTAWDDDCAPIMLFLGVGGTYHYGSATGKTVPHDKVPKSARTAPGYKVPAAPAKPPAAPNKPAAPAAPKPAAPAPKAPAPKTGR